ncbi:MAG: 2,4-dienoyl-CoA reductase-like NADH-dependent reductase (Old Yellow Enzyme family) [Granulosicoccus sp.]|jgi:2,4-dienoyl-CoA reductase-like NADH-dependent reductase (Old Yellow Enzyme family)/thioredoxin reductase
MPIKLGQNRGMSRSGIVGQSSDDYTELGTTCPPDRMPARSGYSMTQLFHPLTIKNLTLRNRVVSTAHAPNFQVNGQPRDQYRLYHEEKAKGGVALTMVGGSTNISPDSPSVFGQLYAGDDSIIPWFRQLSDGVHTHGAAIMCQITHMGRRTSSDAAHWLPAIAPSNLRERAHRTFPKAMETHDISRTIDAFVQAAKRCEMGGFDGIELLSHAHLLGQFLSPLTNRRTDAYGGSLDNRLRLTLEVLDAIRAEVHSDFIVSVRMTGDEMHVDGLSRTECLDIATLLDASKNVDLLNVLLGSAYDDIGLAQWVPPMGFQTRDPFKVTAAIRQSVSIPVLYAGGISDIATAKHAISEGLLDLIGMTRAQIADPYLVNKVANGQEDRIRPCVGLGYCVDRVNQGKQAVCGHNAATGREYYLPHIITPSSNQRKIVIVGAGPAGLEAARVCAARGHKVVLFEASDRLGGQLILASQSSIRKQVSAISDWLIQQITRMDVDIQLNVFAEPDEILQQNPDVVIIATGGWPEAPSVIGGELTMSSWDILGRNATATGDVLLIDEIGDHATAVTACVLAEHNATVKIITPDRCLLQEMGPTNSAVSLRELTGLSVKFECLQELTAITQGDSKLNVQLTHVLTGQITDHLADSVVVEHGLKPENGLYYELKEHSRNLGQLDNEALINGRDPFEVLNPYGRFYLAAIGDCIAGRNIHAAILEGLRTCVTL